jgi:hypothetical protein
MYVPYVFFFFHFSLTALRIAGLEWVFLEAKTSGRPSVVNISSGRVGKSLSLNEAIRRVSFLNSAYKTVRPAY